MSRRNKVPLSERVADAAQAALSEQKYVSAIDVLVGLGWVYPSAVPNWRQGRIENLEQVVHIRPGRLLEALRLLGDWARAKGLIEREAEYVARTLDRRTLRFTESGRPEIEQIYRTHWVSPTLSEARQERLTEKLSAPPDLVVIVPLKDDWTCHRCGGSGDLLIMENPGPSCLRCTGLDDLEFLPAGDALLTRRAKAKSKRSAVVVRFSRSRKRYERQGLLVEADALSEARRELESKAAAEGEQAKVGKGR